MKRAADKHWDASRAGWVDGNKRIKRQGPSVAIMPSGKSWYAPPTRVYNNSVVPLASRGYTPNTEELKVFDTVLSAYQMNTTGTITPVFIPQLGSDMNQRIGRKCVLKSVYLRGYSFIQGAFSDPIASGVSAPVQLNRLMFVWDTQPNGAVPAMTDILTTSSSASQLNINNRDRFKILMDKQWIQGPFIYNTGATVAVAEGQNVGTPLKKYKRLNLETIFGSTSTGAIADITSGALLVVTIGSLATSTNDSEARFTVRVRYSDK